MSDPADLCRFIAASPSPYHVVKTATDRLIAAGYQAVDPTTPWPSTPGRWYVANGGSLVAWHQPPATPDGLSFRIVGAHTDSPNLRLKPKPDTGGYGYRQLGVEVYGGALWNSWLDRDLGLSGRITLAAPPGAPHSVESRLVLIDRPVARIPQLAIHLDRGVNESGLKLNPQLHLSPLWGLGTPKSGDFLGFVAASLDLDPSSILGHDLMFHDLTPPALLGESQELLSAPRIDNQLSCWAALEALLDPLIGAETDNGRGIVAVIALFDHEEVGSESATGAASAHLATVLERISLSAGATRDAFHASLARSVCVSADGAHAQHPNYPERHEPEHRIVLNQGPVLKHNANARYATDAVSSAEFRLAAEACGVPLQSFVVRSDIACGSTIGPVTAARLGIPVVDVGVAQLSMHASRELCGTKDPGWFVTALTAFLSAAPPNPTPKLR